MRFNKVPAWVWIVLVIGTALALGTSPFWLLAIACNTGSGC